MGTRGRKSAAELAVVPDGGITAIHRPGAPDELTDEQAYEWLAVVNCMPADHFARSTHAMLTAYCKHVVANRRVGQLIAAEESRDEIDVLAYDRLLKMQEREGRAISSLMTKMRISQQSTLQRERKKPPLTKKPWET